MNTIAHYANEFIILRIYLFQIKQIEKSSSTNFGQNNT